MQDLLLIFGCACLGVGLIFAFGKSHLHFTAGNQNNIQNLHSDQVSRIGGLAIFVALIVGFYLLNSDAPERIIFKSLLVAALPIVLIGLLEDLTQRISVAIRLICAMSAAVFICVYSGLAIKSVGFELFDPIFEFRLSAILFTAICLAGLVHAINIIDGLNGLAAGFVCVALSAIGVIAASNADFVLAAACWMLLAATLGFLVWNWPWGKIFLGDGGAYLLGFALAWNAVLLPTRNASVSPWASFLILLYPVVEIVFSLLRRTHARRHPMQPDRLHLHSLIKKRFIAKRFSLASVRAQNSIASLVALSFGATPALIAALFYDRQGVLIVSSMMFVCAYYYIYQRFVRFG